MACRRMAVATVDIEQWSILHSIQRKMQGLATSEAVALELGSGYTLRTEVWDLGWLGRNINP